MSSRQGSNIPFTEVSSTRLLPSVHFFNPGYEATLERGIQHFTPPLNVLQFRKDCALLPLYLPDSTGHILITDGALRVETIHGETFPVPSEGLRINPWGWAPELIGLLPEVTLPYSTDEMRYFGSRLRSVELWYLVYTQAPEVFEPHIIPPIVLDDAQLPEDSEHQRWVIKSEFSSSGRGVQFAENQTKALGIIAKNSRKNRASHLVLEPWLDMHSNRGYEFHRSEDGTITYLGGSDFYTVHGRYLGNRLVPPARLEEEWSSLPTSPSHDTYLRLLTKSLETLNLGSYSGLLGVDTMVYRGEGQRLYLSPCIELNVRPTMGHIAHQISRQYLGAHRGYFAIEYSARPHDFTTQTPVFAHEGSSLPPGHYPLVPLSKDTKFSARLSILKS